MSESVPDVVYHYTSFEVFEKILESREFWLTSAQFLNDMREMLHGLEQLQRAIDLIGDRTTARDERLLSYDTLYRLLESRCLSSYVGSFSGDGDLLSQWRAYAVPPDRGCAIGFSSAVFRTGPHSVGSRVGVSNAYIGTLVRCAYDQSEQQQMCVAIVRRCIDQILERYRPDSPWGDTPAFGQDQYDAALDMRDEALRGPVFAIAAMKVSYFWEEQEWRLVVMPEVVAPDEKQDDVRRRDGRNGPVSYVGYSLGGIEEPPLGISEVVAGPIADATLTQELSDLLAAHGLSHVPVRKSRIPLRQV